MEGQEDLDKMIQRQRENQLMEEMRRVSAELERMRREMEERWAVLEKMQSIRLAIQSLVRKVNEERRQGLKEPRRFLHYLESLIRKDKELEELTRQPWYGKPPIEARGPGWNGWCAGIRSYCSYG